MMSFATESGTPARRSDPGSDRDLTTAVASGDLAARRRLVERLLDRTRRTIGYVVGADREADDMAQIALIQILRSAGTFRGDCSLEFWADRIAIRTAMRELRRRKRREQVEAGTPALQPDREPGADAEADLNRLRTHLALMLGKLTPERRTAIVLHHVQGYTIAEIAELTGSKINTVRDRLRVGRSQLRKRMLADPKLRSWLETRNR
jgi:RNA polymerase sigma-70 factor (ECF subfamily)